MGLVCVRVRDVALVLVWSWRCVRVRLRAARGRAGAQVRACQRAALCGVAGRGLRATVWCCVGARGDDFISSSRSRSRTLYIIYSLYLHTIFNIYIDIHRIAYMMDTETLQAGYRIPRPQLQL